MRLSVLMPVFNEEATVATAIKRVLDVRYPVDVEVVVVDDASTDSTSRALDGVDDPRVIKCAHDVNSGKGAAIRTASRHASGDYMIILDADLEYAPEEIPLLLAPVLKGDAEVVFGTRTFGSHSSFSYWYVLGNRLINTTANVLFNCYISDLETCFKLLPLDLYQSLDVKSRGFGMEAELTAKLLAAGYRPYEVPISYRARSRSEGKKITWRDGVVAIGILAKTRVQSDTAPTRARPTSRFSRSSDTPESDHLGPTGA